MGTRENSFLGQLRHAIDFTEMETIISDVGCDLSDADTSYNICHSPIVLLKTLILQYCYGLDDSQCHELVADRISWRQFVGLSLEDNVPDATSLGRFRAKL